ncbi:RsfA family transcriptional regulator [Robertmurraya kyonggiensis]|uniref:RsfA family transcriptional regulator n=1 Tax=Robertmurraya kyonggiensis TaxID=1037680 RepID=A0A4V6WND8_9BACI|nr:RsfA family transcriptional regulator [Robertmurraya kyonggiensis]TKC18560.1 RsfA family transcriptional regulator [Robertmurraya kyonggiensis]
MPTNRQDAWSNDEDLLLAEVVLRHIREGGTQLQAFEEVGKQLSRTAAACGFRWNSYVRKQYKSGIELAKKQRKEQRKQAQGTVEEKLVPEEITSSVTQNEEKVTTIDFDDLVSFLKVLYQKLENTDGQSEKIHELEQKVYTLSAEKEKLLNELQTIEQDYKALIEIMERARKMVVLQEEDRQQKVKFQMDKNGNLERIEK